MNRTLIATLAALIGLGCAEEAPNHSTLTEHPCEIPVPAGRSGEDLRCATLTTPQVREEPDGPQVNVEVAVLRAREEATRPPLVFIGGGPGLTVLDGYLQTWGAESVEPFARDRDVVFFDPRGTGRSTPSLHCPEVDRVEQESYVVSRSGEEDRQALLAAYVACHDRLESEGVSTRGVHSAAIARDIVEMMEGLGYERYSVYGLSYGARIALALLRDAPEHVESAILDSPVTPEAHFGGTWASALERSIAVLSEACAASESCSTQHADLAANIYEVSARLDADPLQIPVTLEGEAQTVHVPGRRFLLGVQSALYSAELYPLVPLAVREALDGRSSLLSSFAPMLIPPAGEMSHGHYAALLCSEELAFESPESVAALRDGARPELVEAVRLFNADLFFDVCERWEVEPRPALEEEPVTSDVPTLLLTGGFDPATPPAWADAATEHLSRSQSVHFPHFGHGVLRTDFAQPESPRCAQRIIRDFLADPTSPVDDGCVAEFAPLL